MPRPRRKTGALGWGSDRFELTRDQCSELLTRLGFDVAIDCDTPRAKEAIQRIEFLLGSYPGAVDTLDRSPRAADYRDTLRPIGKKADALWKELSRLGTRFRKSLEAQGIKLEKVEYNLGMLAAACEALIQKKLAGEQDSRGRPTSAARSYIITGLQKVFAEYYRGPDEPRVAGGAAMSLSEREADEEEFVTLALRYARINHPRNLRRHRI